MPVIIIGMIFILAMILFACIVPVFMNAEHSKAVKEQKEKNEEELEDLKKYL